MISVQTGRQRLALVATLFPFFAPEGDPGNSDGPDGEMCLVEPWMGLPS